MSTKQAFTIRCVSCGNERQISHDDGRTSIQTKGTDDTPSSKAHRMQRRVSSTCPSCGEERLGVSKNTAEN